MLDHIAIAVSSFEVARAFFERALAPLGYRVMMQFGQGCGFGVDKPDFWIFEAPDRVQPMHIAFASPDRPTVEAFHAAALEAGGKDNGGPGLRTQYHPHYFGAFVFDPDGNNIEAVYHGPA